MFFMHRKLPCGGGSSRRHLEDCSMFSAHVNGMAGNFAIQSLFPLLRRLDNMTTRHEDCKPLLVSQSSCVVTLTSTGRDYGSRIRPMSKAPHSPLVLLQGVRCKAQHVKLHITSALDKPRILISNLVDQCCDAAAGAS